MLLGSCYRQDRGQTAIPFVTGILVDRSLERSQLDLHRPGARIDCGIVESELVADGAVTKRSESFRQMEALGPPEPIAEGVGEVRGPAVAPTE